MTRSGLLFLLTMSAMTAAAQDPAPAQADTFEREALAVLRSSHAQKKGIVVYVGREAITGVVEAIGPDVVILSNRLYRRIVVRRDRIDAILGD